MSTLHQPARVGLVVGQLTTGGAEGQLLQVTRAIDRKRFEPIVYCLSSQIRPVGELLRTEGVTLRVTPVTGWRRAPWLAAAFVADEIDVVHAWLYIANAITWLASWVRRPPPMITSARNCKVQGRVSQLANLLAFRRSRAILVNSHEVAAYIVRHYRAPQPRIRVIYNGIDTVRFHPTSPAGGRPDGPIVGVGRLVEQKNHAMFLEAAARLCRDVPTAHFAIVGDGPLRAGLEGQARTLGIAERVQFLGERGDIDDILRTASLFWLTSRWEGMPNVVLEAMASGVPVLATDVGGTRELVRSGVEGFVVSGNDVEAFVTNSRALLLDAARWQQVAAAARARAEEFSTVRMVGALSQLYDDVLGQAH